MILVNILPEHFTITLKINFHILIKRSSIFLKIQEMNTSLVYSYITALTQSKIHFHFIPVAMNSS